MTSPQLIRSLAGGEVIEQASAVPYGLEANVYMQDFEKKEWWYLYGPSGEPGQRRTT